MSVSIFVSLCFTTIAEGYKQTVTLSDFLSEKHVQAQIYTDENIRISDLVDSARRDTANNFFIYKNFESTADTGKAVYFKGKNNFNPHMVEGRNFTEADFIDKTNTVLIEESIINKCVVINGKRYYSFNHQNYEVIGVYQSPEKLMNKDSLFYLNLSSELQQDYSINGLYFFDSLGLQECKSMLSTIEKIEYEVYPYELSFSQSVNIVFNNIGIVIVILCISILLILLNIFGATYAWILNKYKEISIRKLAGATDTHIRFYTLSSYFIILLTSFIIGSAFSYAILKIQIFSFLPHNVNFIGIIASFVFSLLLGFSTLYLCLQHISKKEIVTVLR